MSVVSVVAPRVLEESFDSADVATSTESLPAQFFCFSGGAHAKGPMQTTNAHTEPHGNGAKLSSDGY